MFDGSVSCCHCYDLDLPCFLRVAEEKRKDSACARCWLKGLACGAKTTLTEWEAEEAEEKRKAEEDRRKAQKGKGRVKSKPFVDEDEEGEQGEGEGEEAGQLASVVSDGLELVRDQLESVTDKLVDINHLAQLPQVVEAMNVMVGHLKSSAAAAQRMADLQYTLARIPLEEGRSGVKADMYRAMHARLLKQVQQRTLVRRKLLVRKSTDLVPGSQIP